MLETKEIYTQLGENETMTHTHTLLRLHHALDTINKETPLLPAIDWFYRELGGWGVKDDSKLLL